MPEQFIVADDIAINLKHVREIHFSRQTQCFEIYSNIYRGTGNTNSHSTYTSLKICNTNPRFNDFVDCYKKMIDPGFVCPKYSPRGNMTP
jgi:hypothetical protein